MDLSFAAFQLGAEAQAVIALRMMKMAAGGPGVDTETRRMVSEKWGAAAELSAKAAMSAMTGGRPVTASHAVAHYRRKVRANARRLMKP